MTLNEAREFLASIFPRIRSAETPKAAWALLTDDEVRMTREVGLISDSPGLVQHADAELQQRGLT